MNKIRHLFTLLLVLAGATVAKGEYPLQYELSTIGNAGTGDFAPYYIASNYAAVTTQPNSIMERGSLWKPITTGQRFSYGFGADLIANWSQSTYVPKYSAATDTWHDDATFPARVYIQQLWGGIRYRSLFIKAGMWEYDRSLFDTPLSIGDIVMSNNSRPIPQVRVGFYDFVDIPLTNHWVQIQGDIAYGKFMDNGYLKDHYNYYNSFITLGAYMHYKRLYLRTNPDKPFSVTVGMQDAAQFAGTRYVYQHGQMIFQEGGKPSLKDFFDVFLPREGKKGDSFYVGNHLGSWDLLLTYRFHNGARLTGRWQSPWEDGSGIGKMNGWDGVYSLEYTAPGKGWLEGASITYFDFTNQSGPVHYAPNDFPDSPYTGEATGSDDYYNNYYYDGWQNYGMSIGTPMIRGPYYNGDGNLRFQDNLVYGFQLGMTGSIAAGWSYRGLFSWRKSKGTPFYLRGEKIQDTSMLLEATYDFPRTPGLSLKSQLAWDAGKLYGDNFGVALTLSYSGILNL